MLRFAQIEGIFLCCGAILGTPKATGRDLLSAICAWRVYNIQYLLRAVSALGADFVTVGNYRQCGIGATDGLKIQQPS